LAALEPLRDRWCLAETGAVLDLGTVFGRDAPAVLEIGFGGGEATLAMALARPDLDHLAVDIHTPGVARVLDGIAAGGLANLRVVHGDALVFLDRVANGCLAEIRVLFPDPWPKRRHHHRRLVQHAIVNRLVARLRVGGALHLATDVADYAGQMQAVCAGHPELRGGPVERPPWRPVTRFEQAGLAAGRRPVDLRYARI
jgi:tRNA (guanine-N7-)-methyltransferase